MSVSGPLRRRLLLAAAGCLLSGLVGCAAPSPPAALNGGDREVLAEIGAYLNGIHTLRARFAQPDPRGGGGEQTGTAWVERPGRLRFEYDPPSQVTLVAAHGRVTFADRANGARSSLPLARTPLSILLADRIVLSGPVTVLDLRRGGGAVDLELRSTDHPGQGELTLHFAAAPIALQGLVLVDGRGNVTRLDLSRVQTGIAVDPALFAQPGA